MLNKSLKDYIVVFENAMTHDLCNAILKEFNNEDEWKKTVVGNGEIKENIRSAETVIISYPHVIEKNLKVRKDLDSYIYISVSNVIKKYNEKFSFCKIEEDSGYELLRYKEGQFYTQHTDSFKARPRAVSCSFALNDDYKGGEWGFFDREKVLKAPKGSAVLFPSNFMYPHEIMPVTKGVRYSVITWFT
jgi:Rps23 Pro-64 3,4-dihydroxylase Tpa1-like proline 4-hydroxylase